MSIAAGQVSTRYGVLTPNVYRFCASGDAATTLLAAERLPYDVCASIAKRLGVAHLVDLLAGRARLWPRPFG